MKRHRGAFVTPGPNYAWSMDAYCKLEFWGIQIYAAIDIYSRCLMWIYVGVTGRTAVSVFAQYIKTLADGGVVPQFIRSDRGLETTMAADAHFQLSQQLRNRESDSESPLAFNECFLFGTSKANQRIESWWNQMCTTSLGRWRDAFIEMSQQQVFDPQKQVDRIALKAVYMPIIQEEAKQFVYQWNCHRIRKQPNRPYTVPGIPGVLYNYPEKSGGQQCGLPVDSQLLEPFQRDLQGFGRLGQSYHAAETANACT